eukprot:CAMPEP_0205909666 /NCGR_PEP_ID=MMETSP1325-20131115/4024_1 /ASSEMBLY_ACC=CAM_ASM_000708 /TAXON_ID=236786 /ORGANISM="Florenciella sp., Strain RCC1007" /LENGTH=103 /DNA_ID=CAMNT_0053275981 /DNA_START=42 /DNA_END=354 /DNA_ORIENTATION=-
MNPNYAPCTSIIAGGARCSSGACPTQMSSRAAPRLPQAHAPTGRTPLTEATVTDDLEHIRIRAVEHVAATDALVVHQVVRLRKHRDDVGQGHEAPNQVREVVL